MRRTYGLTALMLLALAILAVAGCSGGGSGAGVLQPFATGTSGGGPTSSPTVSPTITPFPTGTATVLPSLDNPTRMDYDANCQDLWMVTGFNLGAYNGRLIRFRVDTQNGVSQADPRSPQVFTLQDAGKNTVQLTNPTWLSVGKDPITKEFMVVVADGFGTAQGRILVIKPEVSAACTYTGTAVVTDLGALASSAPTNPLAVHFDGKFVWWTEYVGTPQGRVRRADLSVSPATVVDYMVGLDFPAGIQSNGGLVALAQNGAGTYVVGPADPIGVLPLPLNDPAVGVLTPAEGDPVMLRPFDLHWSASNSLITLDGFGLSQAGGPGPAGAGNGNLRYFSGPGNNFANKTLLKVKTGLTDPVGLGLIFFSADRNDVSFVESIPTAGTVRRVGFSTTLPYGILNDQTVLTNFSRGFHALPVPPRQSGATLPERMLLFITQGFDLGLANGSVIRYSGAFGN